MKKNKIVIVIASKDFRDEEYFITKEVLEEKGFIVKTSSNDKKAIGRFGNEANVNLLIEDINSNNFDAIIFAGGSGAIEYIDNKLSYNLCNDFINKGKVVGAICIAPTILAKAGVLKGKKVTVFPSGKKIIEENGGKYQKETVVIDGKIITGENADSSKEFGESIAKVLTNY
ncbi:MAG: DJ-1/PfpI family protein [Candidatus Pacebacteria bacterium]|nr:DJ-1/PfpI family protein [Candidatus Paceibacterota bacterium]MDD4074295.1 DJ-1/PfpI family protein [Candidatus Paceibacterota bacterium]